QANRASAAGDRGQPDERRRIECSIVVVLAEPHRVEPRRFGALALADGLLEIAPGLQRAQPGPHVDVLLVGRRSEIARVPRWRAFADVLSLRGILNDPGRAAQRAQNLCAIA